MVLGPARFGCPSLLRIAPVGVLLLCAAAAIGLSYRLLQQQGELSRTFRYDVTWDASHALDESLKFQLAVTQIGGSGATEADLEAARLKFEVLESGLTTLLRGDTRRLVDAYPEGGQTVADLKAAVDEVRELLPGIDQAETRARVLDRLRPLNARVGNLASVANTVEAAMVVDAQQQLGRYHWRLSGLLAALVVFGMLLVALLSRRNRLLTNANGAKQALAEDLQLKSEEVARAHRAVQAVNAELRLGNAHFHAALQNMSQGLCMVDAAQRLIVCNRRFVEMFRLDPAAAVPGVLLATLISGRAESGDGDPDGTRALQAEHLMLSQQGRPSGFVHERPDGKAFAVSHQPLPEGGWVATYEDVTERRRTEAQIAHMAHHDALTGLPNRALYRRRIEEILSYPRDGQGKLSVLLLDLDHFKEINDTLGHGAGDALLEAVALRLRGCTREADLVARLGGDEFAIIHNPGLAARDVTRLAERVLLAIGEPFDIDGERVVMGASVGIAVEPEDGASGELLLKYADLALYQAKASGRGMWCFYEPEMDARVQTRRAISADLREALRLGQLEVQFQPLIDLARSRVGGFEALLRWRHPERGLVPPVQFIPLAEETGLIVPIGDWVLRQACIEATQWPEEVKIAVNLSPRQFSGGNVARMVQSALDQTGLAPGRLELEITESLLLTDAEDVLAALRELRDLGVGVALDDFGTGYSSLSYLRKFPFSKLKIDQSFVRGMDQREDCIIIIQAVAAMAKRLGMTVTAEGIETDEQLAIVREAGCNQGQGYLFGRPARPAEAIRLLARDQEREAELQVAI
jgi:diguanylate cyclase (GGDEF)-like protein